MIFFRNVQVLLFILYIKSVNMFLRYFLCIYYWYEFRKIFEKRVSYMQNAKYAQCAVKRRAYQRFLLKRLAVDRCYECSASLVNTSELRQILIQTENHIAFIAFPWYSRSLTYQITYVTPKCWFGKQFSLFHGNFTTVVKFTVQL